MPSLAPDALRFDVIVIGAGPTGLTLANLVGRYGLKAALVERNPTTVHEPRAVSIDDESLRTMQALGVVDRVMEHMVPGYGSEYFTPSGHLFLTVSPTEAPFGFPRRNAFRQPILEAQLRDHLNTFETVTTLFGWTFDSLRQDSHYIEVILKNGQGDQRRLECCYLVGADGASSSVRSELGLSLDGESFEERWLILDLENSPTSSQQTQVFCDFRRPCIALPGPDRTRRFEFKLRPTETTVEMTSDQVVQDLLKKYGADPGSIVKRKAVYNFHARVAPKWSHGRAFLAGDACHLTPPFAGQGMNSGIRDAHNLAWKLAAVCKSSMGPRLLESYEAERRPHVRQMIDLALQIGRIMGPPNPFVGQLTQTAFRMLGVWPPVRDYFGQMRYKPKPRFTDGFLLRTTVLGGHPAIGRLIPQPRVIDACGRSVPLDELLGDGFSLIAVTSDAAGFVQATSAPVFAKLGAVRLAISEIHPPDVEASDAVRTACDPAGTLNRLADQRSDFVFMVRPDRYVIGVFEFRHADVFARALERLIETGGNVSKRAAEVPGGAPSRRWWGALKGISAAGFQPRSRKAPDQLAANPRGSSLGDGNGG